MNKLPRGFLPKLEGFLIVLLFFSIALLVFVFFDRKDTIYPPLHIDQPNPKTYIEQKAKELPPNLPKPEVIEHGSRDKKWIALTFDADMTYAMKALLESGNVKSWYNREIKKTLDRENVKATIFLTGLWAEIYPNESYNLAHDPLLEIGNHSYSHPGFTAHCYKLPLLDNKNDEFEVLGAQNAIAKATGITPKYFRFPGGCYDNIDLETISRLGLIVVHWDVVSGDGFNKNTNSIIQTVESRVQNGSIIVFHLHGGEFAPKTNDALVKIIPYLRDKGYQFVTISEMLKK